MSTEQEVLWFIRQFTRNGKREQVVECFTTGCCYYFAQALMLRFQIWEPTMMYAEVENHFGCRINGRVYDIQGDVTDKFPWITWEEYCQKEPKHAKHIEKYCVYF